MGLFFLVWNLEFGVWDFEFWSLRICVLVFSSGIWSLVIAVWNFQDWDFDFGVLFMGFAVRNLGF